MIARLQGLDSGRRTGDAQHTLASATLMHATAIGGVVIVNPGRVNHNHGTSEERETAAQVGVQRAAVEDDRATLDANPATCHSRS